MGIKLGIHDKDKSMDTYWSSFITDQINNDLNCSNNLRIVINLASEEYFKAVDCKVEKTIIISNAF